MSIEHKHSLTWDEVIGFLVSSFRMSSNAARHIKTPWFYSRVFSLCYAWIWPHVIADQTCFARINIFVVPSACPQLYSLFSVYLFSGLPVNLCATASRWHGNGSLGYFRDYGKTSIFRRKQAGRIETPYPISCTLKAVIVEALAIRPSFVFVRLSWSCLNCARV